jgi:hypothetical protein
MKSDRLSTHYSGECDCGAIKFTCEGEPIFTQHCHCNKCREVSSLSTREKDKLGYGFTAAYPTNSLKIVEGNDHLDEVIKNRVKHLLCKSCHSLIYGISLEPEKQGGIGVNANNFIFSGGVPESFKPVRHVWYKDRIVDMNDDLPKFIDQPKDQFGSGELF